MEKQVKNPQVIVTNDVADDNWRLFEKAAFAVPKTFIWGPPGLGKSYTAQQILRTIKKDCLKTFLVEQ